MIGIFKPENTEQFKACSYPYSGLIDATRKYSVFVKGNDGKTILKNDYYSKKVTIHNETGTFEFGVDDLLYYKRQKKG
jgi:hypothetical protein